MKRIGYLFDDVVEPDNLRLAFWKASRGRRLSAGQRAFASDLSANLSALREGLLTGDYPVGRYHRFTIHEPKERLICAASFGERVLHHALMNVCEPWLERWLSYDTYACRKGKGQIRAVVRAQSFAAKRKWFLKCDFHKYFDSIPHEGLWRMLNRRFKDERLVEWFVKIIATYETTPGRGLPIGNLTSQHLANLYLDPLDRLVPVPYVRYMDDFVFWSDSKDDLKRIRDRVTDFATKTLGLALNEPFINRTDRGMDFLGMRLFPRTIRLNRTSRDRYRRRLRSLAQDFAEGRINEEEYQTRARAATAFVQTAASNGWREKAISEIDDEAPGRTVSNVAAAITTTSRTALRRTATTTTRRTRTTTTASASSASQRTIERITAMPPSVSAFPQGNKERSAV